MLNILLYKLYIMYYILYFIWYILYYIYIDCMHICVCVITTSDRLLPGASKGSLFAYVAFSAKRGCFLHRFQCALNCAKGSLPCQKPSTAWDGA